MLGYAGVSSLNVLSSAAKTVPAAGAAVLGKILLFLILFCQMMWWFFILTVSQCSFNIHPNSFLDTFAFCLEDYTASTVGVLGPDMEKEDAQLAAEAEDMDNHTHGMTGLFCYFLMSSDMYPCWLILSCHISFQFLYHPAILCLCSVLILTLVCCRGQSTASGEFG